MDWIKDKLSSIGAFLVLAGILSSVLQLVGYELRILKPLTDLGPGPAWGIRLGLIAVGALLFFLSGSGAEGAGEHGSGASGGADDDEDEDWDTYRAKAKADPRFGELWAKAQQAHRVSFDAPTDADTYQIVHWAFANETGQQVGPEDPSALYLSLYLQRDAKPKRISFGTTLATGEVITTELSGMQWNYLVP